MRNVHNREFKHCGNTELSNVFSCDFRKVRDIVVWTVIAHRSDLVELFGFITCVESGLVQIAKTARPRAECAWPALLGRGSSAGSRGQKRQWGRRGHNREWSRSDRQGTAKEQGRVKLEKRRWDEREMTTCALQTPLSHACVWHAQVCAKCECTPENCACNMVSVCTPRTHSSCYCVGAKPCGYDPILQKTSLHHHLWENTFRLPSSCFWSPSPGLGPPGCFPPMVRCMSECFSVFRGMLFFWSLMMPLCGVLNLSSVSSRSIISNCVRAFVQPPVTFHESAHLSVVFFGRSCRRLQWVA